MSVPIEQWRVVQLLLDDENPRLPPDLKGASQDELLQHFEAEYDLEEIARSIIEHGYFEEEPLLTVPGPSDELQVVVEGNRRLATLQLLTSPESRALITGSGRWDEFAEAAKQAGHSLDEVPVRKYTSHDELLDYLGFRHVSGLLPWTPEAKARYVHRMVVEHNRDFQEVARRIGSRTDAVRRQFIAYRALEQASAAGLDVTAAENRFGVFYRSLQNPRIRRFVQLDGWTDGTPESLQPIAEGGLDRLGELLDWMFGSPRVIRDSRQLDQLAQVLDDPVALALLRRERDLELARQELPADRDALFAALRVAYRNLAQARSEAYRFAGDVELLSEVQRIEDLVNRIRGDLAVAAETSEATSGQ